MLCADDGGPGLRRLVSCGSEAVGSARSRAGAAYAQLRGAAFAVPYRFVAARCVARVRARRACFTGEVCAPGLAACSKRVGFIFCARARAYILANFTKPNSFSVRWTRCCIFMDIYFLIVYYVLTINKLIFYLN